MAPLVAAFLYQERYHRPKAVDLLARVCHFSPRHVYRKIEKFPHRRRMRLEVVWQWLWDHYTEQLRECFVLVEMIFRRRRLTSEILH